jgi:hypothetical protein
MKLVSGLVSSSLVSTNILLLFSNIVRLCSFPTDEESTFHSDSHKATREEQNGLVIQRYTRNASAV